jgi:hypothetical protein
MSTNDQNKSNQQQQQSPTPPSKTKIVQVQGNTIPKTIPNQQLGQPQPGQQVVAPAPGSGQVPQPNQPPAVATDPDNIDIGKFIAENVNEVRTGEEKENEKKKKMEYLTKAINSRFNFERIVFNNSETGEFVGSKMQYVKDTDGKTIYDYINDPVVTEHIQFVVPEDDPQDGSPVNKQITFFWTKPTF